MLIGKSLVIVFQFIFLISYVLTHVGVLDTKQYHHFMMSYYVKSSWYIHLIDNLIFAAGFFMLVSKLNRLFEKERTVTNS